MIVLVFVFTLGNLGLICVCLLRVWWLGRCSETVMAADSLAKLSRKHGVKVGAVSLCSVVEVALAVGDIVGHSSFKSAARMNKTVVLFLEKVETGITVKRLFEPWCR